MADVDQWCPDVQCGAVLVTVNQRLARHYQRRYDAWQLAQGNEYWESPAILSWRSWLLQLHDDALCEGVIDLPVISAALDERLWRQAVARECANSARALLDMDAAAQQAQAAWVIQHAWHCYAGDNEHYSVDQKAYQQWSLTFRQLCHQHHVIDEPRLAYELRQILEQQQGKLSLSKQVLFAGFLAPTNEQQVWWQSLDSAGIVVRTLTTSAAIGHSQCQQCLDDVAEWRAAAEYARSILEQNPQSLIGVVVPELHSVRTAVLRVFDSVFFPAFSPLSINNRGRPYDISLGVSLAEQPVIRCALQILRFLTQEIPSADVSSVLLSPYFRRAQAASEQRRQLDRKIRDARHWELSAKQLLAKEWMVDASDKALIEGLQKSISELATAKQSLSVWSKDFGIVLQRHMKWPGTALDSLEYQAVQIWQQVIDELEALDDGQAVSVDAALQELKKLCSQRLFQPQTPLVPIQIMGRLESHGLRFDHLWVSGCDSAQWPPRAAATTLIPRALQQLRGVPEASASARLALAQLEWQHWRQSAPIFVASYALTRAGQALLAASCVADLELDTVANRHSADKINDPVNHIAASAQWQLVKDTHGPEVAAGERVKGGSRRIEDQAKCPFRGFAIHHLRIRPLEEPGMGLDPRGHGNLLHIALERFWGEVKTSAALHALDDGECDAAIARAVEASLTENAVDAALADLERTRLLRLVNDWLAIERTRVVGFTVESMEQEQLVDVFGLQIRVLIDRIDRLDSGERIILDYKTGRSNKPHDWALQRIGNPQLPLYATVDENVEGVSFAQVAQNDMGFKGVTRESGWLPRVTPRVRVTDSPQDWDAWRDHWRESLQELAAEIRAGVASITPSKDACTFCDLKPLCRYQPTIEEYGDVDGH